MLAVRATTTVMVKTIYFRRRMTQKSPPEEFKSVLSKGKAGGKASGQGITSVKASGCVREIAFHMINVVEKCQGVKIKYRTSTPLCCSGAQTESKFVHVICILCHVPAILWLLIISLYAMLVCENIVSRNAEIGENHDFCELGSRLRRGNWTSHEDD